MASFPQFANPRMPFEIQDLIWSFAIFNIPPRIVELNCKNAATIRNGSGDVVNVTYDFKSTAFIPHPLHACRRSRAVFQSRRSLTFPSPFYTTDGTEITDLPSIPRTWFDFEGDTLIFLAGGSMLPDPLSIWSVADFPYPSRIDLSIRSRVRKIAVSFDSALPADSASSADSDDEEDSRNRQRTKAMIFTDAFPRVTTVRLVYWFSWDLIRKSYDLTKDFVDREVFTSEESRWCANFKNELDALSGVGEVEVILAELSVAHRDHTQDTVLLTPVHQY